MIQKYDDVKTKVAKTKLTLAETSLRVERQNHLSNCIRDLKERAERVAETRRAIELVRNDCMANNNKLGGGRVDYALTVQRLQEKLANKKAKEEEDQAKLYEVDLSEETVKTEEAKLLALKK